MSPADPPGLAAEQAPGRLREFGPNEVEPPARAGMLVLFAATFLSPLALILLVAAGVSAAVGEYTSTGIIAVDLLSSSGIQFWQTLRSDEAVRALREGVA